METLDQRIRRVTSETVAIVPYDPRWPERFEAERQHLLASLPQGLVVSIEHVGSTAVPGLAAKPIVDMLVEVSDLSVVKARVVALLEAQGYEYYWRPLRGDDEPPYYAWFIKRDPVSGARTHHIHMVDGTFPERDDWLAFRDYLIAHPAVATDYAALKVDLAAKFLHDRVGYTQAKTRFISAVVTQAGQHPRA